MFLSINSWHDPTRTTHEWFAPNYTILEILKTTTPHQQIYHLQGSGCDIAIPNVHDLFHTNFTSSGNSRIHHLETLSMLIILMLSLKICASGSLLSFVVVKTWSSLTDGTDEFTMCPRVQNKFHQHLNPPLIAMFMGPTWGPPGADRTQVGPMLAP